jgi:hypothetical protein
MAESWSTEAQSRRAGPSGAEQETIALLEEEIARLEAELRMRDLATVTEVDALRDDTDTGRPRSEHDRGSEQEQQVCRLQDELAAREETIALLLEQVRLADEAEAASHAEWEQLHLWVQELERRVADRGEAEPAPELRAELEAERRSAEALRQSAEKAERSWDVERRALVAEVERLRARFTEVAGQSDTSIAAVRALEHENQALRDAYALLARTTVPAHDLDGLLYDLKVLQQKHDALVQELEKERDQRQRERNEHEASLNALRTQLARDSLRRQEEQVRAASVSVVPAAMETPLEADMRIRALREHLKEIHRDESEQRMRRSLAARLSRLWNHTVTKS